jgi:hypothetical protein
MQEALSRSNEILPDFSGFGLLDPSTKVVWILSAPLRFGRWARARSGKVAL